MGAVSFHRKPTGVHPLRWGVLALTIGLVLHGFSQEGPSGPCTEVQGSTISKCSDAILQCAPTCVDFNLLTFTGCGGVSNLDHWFDFYVSAPGNLGIVFSSSSGHTGEYILVGPFTTGVDDGCTNVEDAVANASPTPMPVQESGLAAGHYFLVVLVTGPDCVGDYWLEPSGDLACEPVDCENCYVSSYSPTRDSWFTITAWVKDEDAPPGTLDFTDPFIEIDFGQCCSLVVCAPEGQIIDGWQRIHERVWIPGTAEYMNIDLRSEDGNVLFDDIRVQPDDASMKCYAYDPVTTRLVAEFDERHYATRYEYDQEGRLNRIKKETERGVMTIQEGRMSMPASP